MNRKESWEFMQSARDDLRMRGYSEAEINLITELVIATGLLLERIDIPPNSVAAMEALRIVANYMELNIEEAKRKCQ